MKIKNNRKSVVTLPPLSCTEDPKKRFDYVMLLPGENEIKEEYLIQALGQAGEDQITLNGKKEGHAGIISLFKAGVLEGIEEDEEDEEDEEEAPDTLGGLSVSKAKPFILACDDQETLLRWAEDDRKGIQELIESRLEELEED